MAWSAPEIFSARRVSSPLQVVALYQRICRATPAVVKLYSLENSPAEVRHLILLNFRKHTQTDPRAIELLLARAEMTFQEVTEQWSQRPHLLALLQPEVKTPVPILSRETFFERFINGTLDDSDLWLNHDRAAQQRALTEMRKRRAEKSQLRTGGQPQLTRATPQLR